MLKSKLLLRNFVILVTLGLSCSWAWAINAPSDPRGTEVGQSVVKWEWARVPGAVNYEVIVDGNYRGLTKDPQYYSRDLWAGEHSLTVRAVGADGSYSSRTPTVKIMVSANFSWANHNTSYTVSPSSNNARASTVSSSGASGNVSVPQNPRGSEVSAKTIKWEWDAVSGAAQYEVTVDGKYATTTSNTQHTSSDLWIGEHSMTVKAVSGDGKLSAQSNTAKVYVVGKADGPAPAAPPPVNDAFVAAPPPQGDPDAAAVKNFVDPASYSYSEVSQKPGYELVFSDEFNGTALNPYRWHSQLRWDGEFNGERYEYRVINGESQFYVNVLSSDQEHQNKIVPKYNPFQFDGGRLAIRATRNPLYTKPGTANHGSLSEMSSQQPFLSGAIATHGKFSQKYGYFEARIKIPSHAGTFPAFWLFHEKRAWEGTQRTEIDIMENLGHAPWYIYNSFHFFKNVTRSYSGDANFIKPKPSGQIFTGIDYSNDYHVYAVAWEPGRVTWYIDGVQTSYLEHPEIDYEDLYLQLNLAIGGNWANFPTNAGGMGRSQNERFPTQNDINNFNDPALEIDYVRVYRRK